MNQIILSVKSIQKQAAWLENEKLQDLMIESIGHDDIVGEIFKGRVRQVVPGMQAAFVDIGFEKFAYLERKELTAFRNSAEKKEISSLVHEGEELIVQVKKEGVGEKGPVVTELVEFPGKYLVYMPNSEYTAVSKKIEDEQERERLTKLGIRLRQEKEGIIFRTECASTSDEQIEREWMFLKEKASQTFMKAKQLSAPAPLVRPQTIVERVIHEWPLSACDELIVDSSEGKRLLVDQLQLFGYESIPVHLHKNSENIFVAYKLETAVEKAVKPFVWLKNGANITIEQTEALTVIDVNSGKFTGRTNKEKTLADVNKEAAKEIARQLRIRNIGGIILVDFINMRQSKFKQEVLKILRQETAKDRMTVHIIGFTRLGLVEVTRKKSRQSVSELLTEKCSCCHGTGKTFTEEASVTQLEQELIEYAGSDDEAVLIEVLPAFAEYVKQHWFEHLEAVCRKQIFFVRNAALKQRFHIRRLGEAAELIESAKLLDNR
ncbi:Rne/Rng family ribonuclease [Bacillus tianshenii]|nr:Rne/Rng family ribonuclease [Bacillus tianshenii]